MVRTKQSRKTKLDQKPTIAIVCIHHDALIGGRGTAAVHGLLHLIVAGWYIFQVFVLCRMPSSAAAGTLVHTH